MNDKFNEIKSLYSNSYRINGNSPASLLTPKGRQDIRFSVLDTLLKDHSSILDFGCGLGHLFPYVYQKSKSITYTGFDITPEFIEDCTHRYPNASFQLINPNQTIKNISPFDIVFLSGVFNIVTHNDLEVSKQYAYSKLIELFTIVKDVLVCDFLSAYVDFQQHDAQHFSVEEISRFCYENLSRKFQIRHDILPYEFTLIVWKDATIQRPDNIYMRNT